MLNIKTGPSKSPIRALMHGQEGVGKTSWAVQCPGVLFITSEDGGGDLDYSRVQVDLWPEFRSALKDLRENAQGFQAICVDTIDTLERLLWDHITKGSNFKTIEEIGGGYGKGYVMAAEEMAAAQKDLDFIRTRHGLPIIILAHSQIKTFNDPMGNPFDRYEIRLHKSTTALWFAWADVCLFACFDVTVKTKKRNADIDTKGKATEVKRVVYTSKDAAYDAKNRYNLPDEMPLSWERFAKEIGWDARCKPTTHGMDVSILEDHLLKIAESISMEDLKASFADAQKSAKKASDAGAMSRIIAAKNSRKDVLKMESQEALQEVA